MLIFWIFYICGILSVFYSAVRFDFFSHCKETINFSPNYLFKRLHPQKAPGLDNITAKMIQELPPSGLTVLLYILNATLRLEHWPTTYKLARVIMVPKPAKPPHRHYLIPTHQPSSRHLKNPRTPPPVQDKRRSTKPRLDSRTPVWFPQGSYHNPAVPSPSEQHQPSARSTRILHGCIP